MIRADFPSEEEQYVVYRKVVEQMRGKAMTFRTLDMGGDKVLSYYSKPARSRILSWVCGRYDFHSRTR